VRWAIQEKSYTQRRACRLVGLEPKTYRYATRRPDDAALRQRLKALASERRRFGYPNVYLDARRPVAPALDITLGLGMIGRLSTWLMCCWSSHLSRSSEM
jgi:hypothetical protein